MLNTLVHKLLIHMGFQWAVFTPTPVNTLKRGNNVVAIHRLGRESR